MPRGIVLRKKPKISLGVKLSKPPKVKSEHSEQASYFTWVRLRYPTLVVYAIPNDAKRSPALAARKKAEGLTAGVPDVTLDEARAGYFGLKLEFKKTDLKLKRDSAKLNVNLSPMAKPVIPVKSVIPVLSPTVKPALPFNGTSDEEGLGGLSDAQKQLRTRMRARGYRVVTVYGFDHARQETDWYMAQPITIGIADGRVVNRPVG